MQIDEKIWYHALTIPDLEKDWIAGIVRNYIEDDRHSPEHLAILVELAWKRGYAGGAR